MFFAGHRPLFLSDHFGADIRAAQAAEATRTQENLEKVQCMPWDVSVSGLPLNPEMKNVPRSIVRNLEPFNPAPSKEDAHIMEAIKFQEHLKAESMQGFNSNNNGVKVFSMEINGNNEGVKSGSFGNGDKNDMTEFSIVVDEALANHPDVVRSLEKIKGMFLNDVNLDDMPQLVYSPVSLSFGRYIEATSVKRKRKLKMNKHKLRKRRKLQRSERRRLKK